MGRPRKQTVDYFPHYSNASSGKTLFILQSKFKNDGYAFWFKLLELLAGSEGHYYDYNRPEDWQFLLAKTAVSEDTAINILNTLVTLAAIDKDLAKKKIIWVQNLLNNIADVYKRRQISLPLKPSDNQRPIAPQPDDLINKIETEDDLKVAVMITYYESETGRTLTPPELEKLKDFADNYPDGWFEKAVGEAKKNNAKSPVRYIEKIMENWLAEGGNPLDDRKRRRSTTDRATVTKAEKLEEGLTKPLG